MREAETDIMTDSKKIIEPKKIIKTNRKSVTLVIDTNGDFIVHAPKFVSDREIMKLVMGKQEWILAKLSEVQKTEKLKEELTIKDGAVIPFMGEKRRIRIGDFRKVTLTDEEIQIPTVYDPEKLFMKWLKTQALYTLQESAEHYAEQLGVTYEIVKLSNARTNWGTCTAKGVIRLSWRLMLCPIEMLDYVVVHELCHIRHMNHSPEFWACVGEVLPDYKTRRKWLKEHSYYMSI